MEGFEQMNDIIWFKAILATDTVIDLQRQRQMARKLGVYCSDPVRENDVTDSRVVES